MKDSKQLVYIVQLIITTGIQICQYYRYTLPSATHVSLLRIMLLTRLHTRHALLSQLSLSLCLPDAPSPRRQVQIIGGDKVLILRRCPLAALPRLDVQDIHSIRLLQRPALALTHKEIRDQHTRQIASGEDVTIAIVDLGRDERGEEGDEKVPRPVAGGAETHGLGAVATGVDLACDAPDDGTPGGGVAEDEEGGEDDHDGAGRRRVLGRLPVQGEVPDRGEDHEAHEHPEAAGHQGLAAAEVLDDVEGEEGGAEVDAAEDHRGDEAVVDAGGGEDGCSESVSKFCSVGRFCHDQL